LLDQKVVHGLAHITGGGLVDNVPRVLPDGLSARFERSSWDVPTVFRVLQQAGGVAEVIPVTKAPKGVAAATAKSEG
jgi:phosphoribosylformylglycinamidine cyclo-ligase